MTTTTNVLSKKSDEKEASRLLYKSCRILYSTQSGRARGCARRTSRILQQQQATSMCVVTNGRGATFDEAIGSHTSLQDFVKDLKNKAAEKSSFNNNNNISDCFLLLFVSTTGDGEHTDTIQQTWLHQLRQKSLPNDLFTGISFAIFNLGDRAYGPQFCAAGRKLTVRLLQLGATLLCEPGYGDDGTAGGGVFADLDVWIQQQLLKTLRGNNHSLSDASSSSSSSSPVVSVSASQSSSCAVLPYKVTVTIPAANNVTASVHLNLDMRNNINKDEHVVLPLQEEEEWQKERFASSYQAFFARLAPYNAYTYHRGAAQLEENNGTTTGGMLIKSAAAAPLVAHVVENRRITAPDWEQQDTRHVRLVLPEHIIATPTTTTRSTITNHVTAPTTLLMLPYQAGDVASIMPCNTVANVKRFLAVLPTKVQELADVELEIDNINTSSSLSSSSNIDNSAATTLGLYGYNGWPKHCTLRGWLTYCADIHALPDREDLYALSHYCSTTTISHVDDNVIGGREQCQKLQSLSEASGASLYTDYILREKRSWADVLYDFDSLRAPGSLLSIEALLALLSPIRPREFSIASSPTLEYQRLVVKQQQQQQDDDATIVAANHDKQQQQGFGIDLCVAVVRGTTARGRKYHGLCSHYFSQLQTASNNNNNNNNEEQQQQQQSSLVRLWIRPGSFSRLPLQTTMVDGDYINDATTTTTTTTTTTQRFVQPVLYIGAGTGIAPLRGLIHERQAQLNQVDDNSSSCSITTAAVVEPPNAADNHVAAVDDDEEEEDDCWKIDDILLFGCRQEKSDYYYQSEWQKLQRHRRLQVITAFSQDQWHKIYVQQVLRKADPTGKKLATHILDKAGCIYIAGGPKMASAVKEEIVKLLSQQLGTTTTTAATGDDDDSNNNEKQAQQLLVRLHRAGRFRVEAWS